LGNEGLRKKILPTNLVELPPNSGGGRDITTDFEYDRPETKD